MICGFSQDEEALQAISIIIPTKNEGQAIAECLRSIFDQSVLPFEVIVVDGGSTDNTLDILKNYDVRIIREGELSSPANARNLGAEKAKGEILLIMDADTILREDCLKQALEVFKDEDVVAILPYESNCDHSYLEFIQRKWNEGSRVSMSVGLRNARTSGGVAFLRKKVFEKVKYDVALGFGEDDDFSTRLEQEFKRHKILPVENCKVISHSPHTMRELAQRYMWWGRTCFAYLAGHFGIKSMLNMASLILPVVLVFASLISFVFPQMMILPILLLSLFIFRILLVCFRSKSTLFFQFAFFDLARSFLFVTGLAQSLFIRKKGR